MGRELKRVALDFDYELDKVWEGYINPHYKDNVQCDCCEGNGYNEETRKLQDEWYSFDEAEWVYVSENRRYNRLAHSNNITEIEVKALVEAGRLMDFTRVPLNDEQRKVVEEKVKNGGNSWLPYDNGYVPTSEEVNEWNRTGMGHDSLNAHICIKARATEMGVYGMCEKCDGEGTVWLNKDSERLAELWQNYDPPHGEGYQLWGTTSEGNPISPVFETLEELCEWCEPNATTFGYNKASKKEWMEMLEEHRVHHKEGNNIFL